MKGHSPHFCPVQWKLSDLAKEIGFSPEETHNFLLEIAPFLKGLELYQEHGEWWLRMSSDAFQHMQSSDLKSHPVIMELFHRKFVEQLDLAVSEKHLVAVTTMNEKIYTVYPHKVLHLEGRLVLVAEDGHDHCLMVMPLYELRSFSFMQLHGAPKVSAFEVDEFIVAIRRMSEKETRLVLKIHGQDSVNLFPDHQFLGKPCMVTNPNGDLIWAAYVEPCEALYEWMISLGKHVEILDPGDFKKDFDLYCEEKERKIA